MPAITKTRDDKVEANLPNVIQVTKKYKQFKLLLANRDVGRGHVEAVKQAIEDNPGLTAAQPLLVNEKLEVIDGQHRLIALEEMKRPVYYVVVPGLRIKDARDMNILHKGWGVMDFAQSYAQSGLPAYTIYLRIREDFPWASHSDVMLCIYVQETTGMYADFRRGDLEIADEAQVVERLSMIEKVREINPDTATKSFTRIFVRILNNPDFDFQRFINKLEAHGEGIMRKFANDREYGMAIEEIYNYKSGERSRTRLY